MKKLITLTLLMLAVLAGWGQTTTVTKPPVITTTVLSNFDTVRKMVDTTITATLSVITRYDTLKYKAPVYGYKRPKYRLSAPLTYSGQSNITISLDSVNSALGSANQLTLNNCSGVHITKCYLTNTTGFAITLNNCTNVLIDSCVFVKVAFGVLANGGNNIKVNNNQGLNRYDPTGLSGRYSHWVQFQNVSGGGNQINYNRFEDIAGQALHPHDGINVYQSNGKLGDSIQVIGNWLRGGQLTMWPNLYSGACGIVVGDNSGSYQVCRNNILVNPGAAGIQCNGNSPNIKVDHNQVYSAGSSITLNAFTVLNPNKIELSYNQTNWTNHNGYNVLLADGETQYWLGSPASPTPVNMSTNYWKAAIGATILPTTIITMK